MSAPREIESDLGYVRDVVARSEADGEPVAIWLLWAAIGLVGFALIDFATEWVSLFWAVAAPAGFAVSLWLGRRHARAAGQESRREARAHALHWAGVLGAIGLLGALTGSGGLEDAALPRAILIVLALAYFLAGVHLVPALKWVGIGMGVVVLAVPFLPGYAWTIVGVVLALGLVATAFATAGDGGAR